MPKPEEKYIGVKDDFFSKPLYPLENVRLLGSKCRDCGEVFLGKAAACQQCQSENMESITLSQNGTLYSYTVARNRPPGDYKGPDDPFQPFPVGLVELPEGIRILSLLDCDIDKVEVGMKLELSIQRLYDDEEGRTVLTYKFKPVKS